MSKLLTANAPVFGASVGRPNHDPSGVENSPTGDPRWARCGPERSMYSVSHLKAWWMPSNGGALATDRRS
jgi:hypothetical protein